MLIKIECGKVNFIDRNDTFIGYDTRTLCCEYADWFLSYKKDKKLTESDMRGDWTPQKDLDVSGYCFDTGYFEEYDYRVQFRMKKKGAPNIYLNLFNCHNGYYYHGFTAQVNGEIWEQDVI